MHCGWMHDTDPSGQEWSLRNTEKNHKPAIAEESAQAASGTAGKAQRSLCCPSELHVLHTCAHGYTWLHTLHKPRRMGKQL